MGTPYDKAFFNQMDEWAAASAAVVVPHLLTIMQPSSILDVGGGTGAWTAAFLASGLEECLCIDGGYVDRTALRIPSSCFKEVDLSNPLDLGRRFDLAVCLEVAEHLEAAVSDQLIESLTLHSDSIVFSAAIPHQGGTHHVNEQWPNYWAKKFAARGYRCFDVIRWPLWSNPEVSWWYKQNTLLYLNQTALGQLAEHERLFASETSAPPGVVHPDVYLAAVDALGSIRDLSNVPRLPWAAKALIRSANASVRHHVSRMLGKQT